MQNKPHIIKTEEMPLEEWLILLDNPPENSLFIDYSFPTDRHLEEYISSISERTEQDVMKLLRRFLIHTGTFGIDKLRFSFLVDDIKKNPQELQQILNNEHKPAIRNMNRVS